MDHLTRQRRLWETKQRMMEPEEITTENCVDALKRLMEYMIVLRGKHDDLMLPETVTQDNCEEAICQLTQALVEYYREHNFPLEDLKDLPSLKLIN